MTPFLWPTVALSKVPRCIKDNKALQFRKPIPEAKSSGFRCWAGCGRCLFGLPHKPESILHHLGSSDCFSPTQTQLSSIVYDVETQNMPCQGILFLSFYLSTVGATWVPLVSYYHKLYAPCVVRTNPLSITARGYCSPWPPPLPTLSLLSRVELI
ncbi:hypothetical protein B0O99DRAFT_45713 [Bisporella sp. PMI_857]|nr:hypothetical protein B0O99DRAFT_45713 [Bisporella sp. PMI_857]